MTEQKGVSQMNDAEIQQLIADAARAGATEALRRVGLDDASAGRDIEDLRSLLTGWRDLKRNLKRGVWRTLRDAVMRLLTLAILAVVLWFMGKHASPGFWEGLR